MATALAERDPSRPRGHQSGPRGPWNPGIDSTLPRKFLPLATIYRPENVSTPFGQAQELSAASGLPMTEIVAFRPERLVVHELLIRVMADLSVPVGKTYGDLGVNFRAIVARILAAYVETHADAIEEAYGAARSEIAPRIKAMLATIFAQPPPRDAPRRSWFGLFRPSPEPTAPLASLEDRALAILSAWRARASGLGDPAEPALAGTTTSEQAASAALHRVVATLIRHRGTLIRDPALIAGLATTLALNEEAGRRIGRLIEPWFEEAVAREGYTRVGIQADPIVMNVKGASASGKSTMRPLQRALAARLGVSWSDFAVITPDIWRKFLLDYDAIGPATGYAGTLTGHELEIVDRKLDLYMARKAREGRMSHLLIDRFRFDSFNADASSQDGSQLLTRFGRRIFMLFMITPPDATVERAWARGEMFGRYKAVDDLLAHNVEAFTGMPDLFFTWALNAEKQVHYEFLDNSVPQGSRPRTVAFGTNGAMTILDLSCVLAVDRYRKINIDALDPASVYPEAKALAPERNTDFLRLCARRMHTIRFAEQSTGRVYAEYESGHLTCRDRPVFETVLADADARAAFAAIGGARPEAVPEAGPGETLARATTQTLGAWGDADEFADA